MHERQRFHRMVDRSGGGAACWPWTGAKADGYGRFKVEGRLYLSHRVAYTLAKGPIPVGKGYHGNVVMHACDNPSCCNPAHLSIGSHGENVRDMVRKGRAPAQKLPFEQTIAGRVPANLVKIICESDLSARALQREIGVHYKHINLIRHHHGVPTMVHRDWWKFSR